MKQNTVYMSLDRYEELQQRIRFLEAQVDMHRNIAERYASKIRTIEGIVQKSVDASRRYFPAGYQVAGATISIKDIEGLLDIDTTKPIELSEIVKKEEDTEDDGK